MARVVGIGHQDFETVRIKNNFYIDKTEFIKEWWEFDDAVTLITRPRRFGKTLNMSMLEKFFSIEYAKRDELFEGLNIWKYKEYREIQGTYPVIFLSFANVKENTYEQARESICRIIQELYNQNIFLLHTDLLTDNEKEEYKQISTRMNDSMISDSIRKMSDYLSRYYGKKTIILLDEYDTPIQEAYVGGFWSDLMGVLRSLLNSTFKTNPYLERAIMTGITRVSKESIFSDLNNLEVVTTTSKKYEDKFGFTQEEVIKALKEYDLEDKKEEVKLWYDGFCFGEAKEIYNPWSIINYLDKKEVAPYWANTSSNSLIGKLIREGNTQVKESFELLLNGKEIVTELDEQIVYDQLDLEETAIWSLLLASGYLKVEEKIRDDSDYLNWKQLYRLKLTNFEVKVMFAHMVKNWFSKTGGDYNAFIKAMLNDDIEAMNAYMNRISMRIFSYFDVGKKSSKMLEPERFYHGFVLGLLVELMDRYEIKSNRESGFGRYDVMLRPRNVKDKAIIMEFKVISPKKEKSLEETAQNALEQIKEKNYKEELIEAGISENNIKAYGFAFEGKNVLISD
ncbi:AAA family ATPase [Anaerostipes amylophilus]|uniref:AAA family ATPase n=1 Tax=Anaerostipes amylophilus TaxID=2981779 RepID=UPI0006C48128|nr:AAA family ATPase [Anaerostipes amylophilus]MCU6782065.1 ATP-binding protein [Anaerostipes amylophilus]CUO41384.1 Predicted AAA-ATPase [Anaerostipes hadrus]